VHYDNFTLTIGPAQDGAYPVTADAGGLGRTPHRLTPPAPALRQMLAEAAVLPADALAEELLAALGEALHGWLFAGPLELALRMAQNAAARAERGLRIRLSIDAPELQAWPWELMRDPQSGHALATVVATPLVRYLDRADQYGGLADIETELPIRLLLVIPDAPDLNLAVERAAIEEAAATLGKAITVRVLQGHVTRSLLADTLLAGRYDIVHFSGHGAFRDGRGYVRLLYPNGAADWMDGGALAQLSINFRSIKLIVLNACNTGQLDTGRAFGGLALQMMRHGIPAVIAMQFPLSDPAATTFAREFYRHLCMGESAGQVDAALTYARALIAVLHPAERSFAAPTLYLRAADGVIFTLPDEPSVAAVLAANNRRVRLAMLGSSLENSAGFSDDWRFAPPASRAAWQHSLERARLAYQHHLADPDPDVRRVAADGLALMEARLTALARAAE
jgi:hypothetical protein